MDNRQAEQENAPPVTEAELEARDRQMRAMLARYEQPAIIEPPPGLALQVRAHLPAGTPAMAAAAERRQRRRQTILTGALLVGVLLLCFLGSWGIFVDSAGPARLLGDPAAGLAQLVLILVLLAKPLVHMLLEPGALMPGVWLATLAVVGALWWYLAQQNPLLKASTESWGPQGVQ